MIGVPMPVDRDLIAPSQLSFLIDHDHPPLFNGFFYAFHKLLRIGVRVFLKNLKPDFVVM